MVTFAKILKSNPYHAADGSFTSASNAANGNGYDKPGMPLRGHPYHTKSNDELRGIMKDAHAAAVNFRDWQPQAEAKYLDQVNDASTVLHYRANKGLGMTTKADVSVETPQVEPLVNPPAKAKRKAPAASLLTSPNTDPMVAGMPVQAASI